MPPFLWQAAYTIISELGFKVLPCIMTCSHWNLQRFVLRFKCVKWGWKTYMRATQVLHVINISVQNKI